MAHKLSVTLSHSGKQHSYHVAQGLKSLGMLNKFYTSSYITQPFLQEYFLKKGNTFFTRRFQPGLSAPDVKARWDFELKEVLFRKLYGKTEKTQNAVYYRDVNFDKYISKLLPSQTSNAFWGFQGSAHQSLQAAKQKGKLAIVELATAHVKASIEILGEEAKLQPDFADSLDNLVFPSFYQKRLEEEPHLADICIAASDFTKQTLLADGIAESKIISLPLGFDMDYVPYNAVTNSNFSAKPLRLLYAGTLTQRKGIKYLLNVMQQLKGENITLTCIGGIQGSGEGLKPYNGLFTHIPAVSQLEMFKLYQEYDALVLPTVFEGFGLVIVEAMAAGLPVITTPHSIGPELITNGENGYIVPIRNEEALLKAIVSIRNLSDAQYQSMRLNARLTVEAYTWKAYQNRLAEVCHQIQNKL